MAGVAEGAGLKIQYRRVSPELPGHSEDRLGLSEFFRGPGHRAQSVGGQSQGGRGTAEGGGKGGRVGDLKLGVFVD